MVGTEHLTFENLSHLATKPGQAHFADPTINHTCRECVHWPNQRAERDKYLNLKPARCRKAAQHLKDPPPIPHDARACRHFEPAPAPPPI